MKVDAESNAQKNLFMFFSDYCEAVCPVKIAGHD
jgi:hypothetical protein